MMFSKKHVLSIALGGLFLIGCSDGFMKTEADKTMPDRSVRKEKDDSEVDAKITEAQSLGLQGAWYSACIQDINVENINVEDGEQVSGDSGYFRREVLVFEADNRVAAQTIFYLDSSCVVEGSPDSTNTSWSSLSKYELQQRDDKVTVKVYFEEQDSGIAMEQSVEIKRGKLTLTEIVDEATAAVKSQDLLVNEYYSSYGVAANLKRKVNHKKEEAAKEEAPQKETPKEEASKEPTVLQ